MQFLEVEFRSVDNFFDSGIKHQRLHFQSHLALEPTKVALCVTYLSFVVFLLRYSCFLFGISCFLEEEGDLGLIG
jgi:hypothetical protein